MNLVGRHGKGESVWLAFFLCHVLGEFAKVAVCVTTRLSGTVANGGDAIAGTDRAERLDGEWYRRAYFDDGSPLGSVDNPECQIDSVAQSWAGAFRCRGCRTRAHGDERVNARLVRRDQALIPASRSAVRQIRPRARIHPWICARGARERWSVHPWRDLDRDGIRGSGDSARAPGN